MLYYIFLISELSFKTFELKVVQDCIEQICFHLGTNSVIEQYEYAIYYVVESGLISLLSFKFPFLHFFSKQIEKTARPLNRCEYIFDIVTELSKLNNEFYLIFKRILWFFPLKFETEGFVDMMYNQIIPDYLEGLIVVIDIQIDQLPVNSILSIKIIM
jgi:myosin-15